MIPSIQGMVYEILMSPTQWKSIKSVFEAALALPPQERSAYLDAECPDPAMRREVESLLSSYEDASGSFLEDQAIHSLPEPLPEGDLDEELFRPGQRLGIYTILQRIGEGGMGTVYQAVRDDAEFRRIVAIKILKRGMDTEYILRRFRNEKQILAHFDHPHVAKLLDGGMTPDGRPYFVLEFIPGDCVDRYCDEQKMPIEARLRLFQKICAAVQYAHQNLVVHRDLKPRNILITLDGEPKLLDFGIAKILSDQRDVTATGVQMLTPGYASPEQMRGEPVTTASDVYSLGVLLYELLTDCKPFSKPADKLTAKTGPHRPSTAVRQATQTAPANVRLHSAKKWSQRLQGDLDKIILKAMHPEAARRYSSVEQFAGDIERHLSGLPVIAAGDSLAYHARKFIARHHAAVVAAVLVFASLATGIIVAAREASVARQQSERAEARARDLRRLTNTLIFDLHDIIRTLPGSGTVRAQLMYRATDALASMERDAKPGECYLQSELAIAYERLGDVQVETDSANSGNLAGAETAYRKATALLESAAQCTTGGSAAQQRLASLYEKLSRLVDRRGERVARRDYLRKAVAIREAVLHVQPDDIAARRSLAVSYFQAAEVAVDQGDLLSARDFRRRALPLFEDVYKAQPTVSAAQYNVALGAKSLAAVETKLGDFAAAERLLQRAREVDQARATANPNDLPAQLDLSFDLSELGDLWSARKDWDSAARQYEAARRIREKLVAKDPANQRFVDWLAYIEGREGRVRLVLQDYPEALRRFQHALALRKQLWKTASSPKTRVDVAESTGDLGSYYCAAGQSGQGRRLLESSVQELRGLQSRHEIPFEYGESVDLLKQRLADCVTTAAQKRP